MMGHVELPAMMSKIVGDFNFSHGKFGDVKDLVMGMLKTYNYENVSLPRNCSSMFNYSLTQISNTMVSVASINFS